MVNEFKIPIENKRPVETVCELKDQVPSYEEFMKDYKVDENLNYSDLSGGGLGEVGGYGPCSYGNPNCECYVGSGFISLHLACPAGCDNSRAYSWTHSGCGGYMYISSRNIHLECKKCYTEGHWKEWSFACSKHPGQWVGATTDEFLDALGLGTNLYPRKTREIKKLALQITIKLESEGL